MQSTRERAKTEIKRPTEWGELIVATKSQVRARAREAAQPKISSETITICGAGGELPQLLRRLYVIGPTLATWTMMER